jgi:hypothetical protein
MGLLPPRRKVKGVAMRLPERIKEFLSSIDPCKDKKYSSHLFCWLASLEPLLMESHQIYRDETGALFIGYCDANEWFYGALLTNVLSNSRTCHEVYPGKAMNLTLLPRFWDLYLEHVCCAVDLDHFVTVLAGGAHFLDIDSQKRRCVWCDRVQLKQQTNEEITHVKWTSG